MTTHFPIAIVLLLLLAAALAHLCAGCATTTTSRYDLETGQWHKETVTPGEQAGDLWGAAGHYLFR